MTKSRGPAAAETCGPAAAETRVPTAKIQMSLLSHTNAGKTTLARTLLREDIGEVGDRAHVTEVAESHTLIESSAGDVLVLWDTPGFGDSTRVLKRLHQSDQPVGWFLSKVWDRLTDRPFWCSQQALRSARDTSDVLLYVMNAGEPPEAVGYVDAEMKILGWIGKPVVLLLNQLGPPREAGLTQAEVERWQAHVARYPWVEMVLPFDAFARCWIQEGTLLAHVHRLLAAPQQPAFERLRAAWRLRNLEVFHAAMQVLATQLGCAAVDSQSIPERGRGTARAWLGAITTGSDASDAELQQAQRELAGRLDQQVRHATAQLVRLHGLSGTATEEVLQRLGSEFAVRRPADADKAGVFGGLISGALGGLAADLAAGGLTIGAGALIGGVLGAFGARSLAKAYNLARGSETGTVRWSPDFLVGRVRAALMRYLSVAHFGRGRGEYIPGAIPAHWQEAVTRALQARHSELACVWSLTHADLASTALLPIITGSAQEVLSALYPESAHVFH
ncbi:MAG TPA: DUF3482 domain-containing protein [Steroidobacteraceae bacterium]|nr:DUF3482 domain-containing protein [Steroidobacteraceae bacterium]